MCRPVAYFKDSMRREHFVMEILYLWGFPLPLDIQDVFSHIFPSIAQLSPLKRADDSLKKREDDRYHYRVSVSWKPCHLGKQILCCSDPHSGKLLCIMFVCFETKEEHFN